MKIVWFVQNLVPYHHARFEAFARQAGRRIEIVQATNKDSFEILEFNPGPASYRLHTLFNGVERREIAAHELRRVTLETVEQLEPDCLCVSGWGLAVGQAALFAGFKLGIPVVLCSDSNEFDESRSWSRERVKRIVVSRCAAFFVAGTSSADYIEKLGGSECVAAYDVVDNAHFARAMERPQDLPARLENSRWFLTCSRFESKKNLECLIEAYAGYLERCERKGVAPCLLVMAGDGELRERIEAKIRFHGLMEKVLLLGAVDYGALPWLYQHSQAFVHASTTEQWGLVVNEAMAAGAPVLISKRCGCIPELMLEGGNGFLFDPYDVADITESLWKFQSLSDADRQAFGERSRSIIQEWSPDRFASSLAEVVDKAVANGPRKNTWIARLLLRLLLSREGAGGRA